MIAEGVETAEQLGELQTMGCALAQGYYFARPLTRKAMGALLGVSLRAHAEYLRALTSAVGSRA